MSLGFAFSFHVSLHRSMLGFRADYLAQAKARAEEKSLAESSLRLAREERDRIASEARRRQKQHVAEAAAKAAEHQAQLATAQVQRGLSGGMQLGAHSVACLRLGAIQRSTAATGRCTGPSVIIAASSVSTSRSLPPGACHAEMLGGRSHAAAEFASALKAATDRADALHDSVEALEAERAASTARARETTATLAVSGDCSRGSCSFAHACVGTGQGFGGQEKHCFTR